MRSLVTGATSGLGAAFARALAAQGSDLVIVARDAGRLAAAAAELGAAHGVEVDVLRADLSVEADLQTVAAALESTERPVDLLVNNAGFGIHTRLTDFDVAVHRHAIDVMCVAVLVLGGAAGRAMRARGHGRIVNISSLASWTTQGHYSAVKAWVRSYSESLSNELHGTGVTVTAACPGWVRTEFHQRAGIRTSALPDWIWQDADPVAAQILADAERGRVLSVPGVQWKITRAVLKVAPASAVRAISRALVRSRD
ncbi:SDR family NAD(P)-dependent oxidoreductase [Propionicimonas sp.]|uniref:SDR family NAD(P)-dependent oxidoreductase n=1 Tax=Propionicimonas sp. TaxID=1955623 RepID=UPI0039E508E4